MKAINGIDTKQRRCEKAEGVKTSDIRTEPQTSTDHRVRKRLRTDYPVPKQYDMPSLEFGVNYNHV